MCFAPTQTTPSPVPDETIDQAAAVRKEIRRQRFEIFTPSDETDRTAAL